MGWDGLGWVGMGWDGLGFVKTWLVGWVVGWVVGWLVGWLGCGGFCGWVSWVGAGWDGCCWETFYMFAYCGLVAEIQPLNC